MQLTITSKKANVLLERTQISGNLEFQGPTPTNLLVAEAIAKDIKTTTPLIIVKHIHTRFGAGQASFEAVAYNTLDAKIKIEPVTKHMKKKREEENKKAADAKAA